MTAKHNVPVKIDGNDTTTTIYYNGTRKDFKRKKAEVEHYCDKKHRSFRISWKNLKNLIFKSKK